MASRFLVSRADEKKVKKNLVNPIFILTFALSNKNSMLMKTYLYYGSEENCFETEKFNTTNPYKDVEGFLRDDYLQNTEIDYAVHQMACDFMRDGFAIYETVQGQGYRIIIGIARHGKCSEITKRIAELRREAIAMCY
jgi:hypothetical protein